MDVISRKYKELLHLNHRKTNNPIKSGQRTWTDISSNKIHKWSASTWKDAQHRWSLRDMQIKTTVSYRPIPTRYCLRGWGEVGTIMYCRGNVRWFSHCGKLGGSSKHYMWNYHMTNWEIPLLGIYLKELKIATQTNTCAYTHANSSSTQNSQKVETAQMFTIDEWINKLQCRHTVQYYSVIKWTEVLIHAAK